MKLVKEIKSKTGVTHFRRWVLFKSKLFSIYIHGIYQEDQDKYLHNHPWNIWTVILYGSYIEELSNGLLNTRKFLSTGFHKRNSYHKIKELVSNKVFSLAITWGKHDDNWGYLFEGKHITNTNFRKYKNGISNWHDSL